MGGKHMPSLVMSKLIRLNWVLQLLTMIGCLFLLGCGQTPAVQKDEQLDDPCPKASKNAPTRVDDRKLETFDCQGMKGPCISQLKWGNVTITDPKNGNNTYKDVVVLPSLVKEWNWKDHKMSHDPGVTASAVQAFIDSPDLTDVILTRGMEGVLLVPDAVIDLLKKAGKTVHVEFTRDAAKLYNELVKQGKKVGGLFHTTC